MSRYRKKVSDPNLTLTSQESYTYGCPLGVALALLIILTLPYTISADELVLVKGKGCSVCEAHYKNLRSLELNDMVCERDKSYPEKNGITRPKWEVVDLRENKELIKKITKFFSKGDQFGASKLVDNEKEFEKYFNENVEKYNLLIRSRVDIGNIGKPETVLLYREPRCDTVRNYEYNIPYSRVLFVLDEAKNLIDVKKTEPLLQNPFAHLYEVGGKAQGYLYQIYDIFIYKNRTYFDKWNVYDWTLSVYIQSNGKAKEVCKYKYNRVNN
jgi:hypothetical protein